MAYIPESNSVVAFQSDPTKLVGTVSVVGILPVVLNNSSIITVQQSSIAAVIIGGSIAASFTPPANQSVSGTVDASIIGTVPVVQSGLVISSIVNSIPSSVLVGASIFGQLPGGTAMIGSITAYQGVTPWANTNVGSIITVGQGSIAVNIISGSIAVSITPPANQSVSGTVDVGNFPAIQTVRSSLAGGIFPISGSVAAFVTEGIQSVAFAGANTVSVVGSITAYQGVAPWIIQPTSGSIIAVQGGTRITSVINSTPSSLLTGASIFGQLPAGTAMLGSVVAYQGVQPWVVNFVNSSIIAINAGSVVAIPVGSTLGYWDKSPSIVGTYAEDSAHTTADKGLFIMGVRNDTVASFAGANGEYNPFGHDSAGRVLGKPFAPEEARVEGYNSVVSTSVTTLVAAAGAGLRNYITDVILANTGATTTLVTFRSGGGTSVVGYGIAPAGGGSNMINFAMPMRTLTNETFDFQATSASSILFAKVSGFKAP